MTKPFFDQVQSLTLAVIGSITTLVMLASISGLNGAQIGQLIV